MKALDLCCGLGGATQAMRDRGWSVVGVDIEMDLGAEIIADIRDWEPPMESYDLVWASPPCTEFTKNGMPWYEHFEPDLSISLAAKRIIDQLNPRFWIIENVRASRKFLTPIFGPVRAMVDGHCFWGTLPGLLPQTHAKKHKMGPRPNRHLLRAKIPYEISLAVCMAIERRQNGGKDLLALS